MVKCLAQGHKRRTDQAGIRTHILTTPELESNTLDCSATTLRVHKNSEGVCDFKIIKFDQMKVLIDHKSLKSIFI